MTTWRPDYSDDPHPFFADPQVQEPLRRGELDGLPLWLVSGYDNVRRLLADPSLRNDLHHAGSAAKAVPWLQADNPHPLLMHLTRRDPPEHTRLRKLVTKAFTARRVEALRPRIELITDRLIDGILPTGQADLISDFGLPLSMSIIRQVLGVPEDQGEEFRRWGNIYLGVNEGDLDRRPQALAYLTDYLNELIEHKSVRRVGDAEDGDLLDGLIAARDEGDRLSNDELLAMAFILFLAGYETTASLIGNGMLALLQHPDQLAALRADQAKIGPAVEELLRFDGPGKTTGALRFTTTEIHVGDTVIPAGETVMFFLSAASRDPDRFPDPARLDIGRDTAGHLGFGYGVHYCLGAPLARLEAKIAFTALLTRLNGLALGPGSLSWRRSYALHSLKTLPVTFTSR